MSTKQAGEWPTWRRAQLRRRLTAAAGTHHGHLDTTAAARLCMVSQRTVQRWLHGHGNQIVGMAKHSRETVWTLLRPSPRKLQQEILDRQYAEQALVELGLPARRRRIPEAWTERDWLSPHVVAVLDVPAAESKQVAVARMGHRPMQRLRRRGKMLDFTEVPTKFHATLLTAVVFDLVDTWRVQLADGWVEQGHGQAWTRDAPAVDLAALAVTNGLR